MKKLATIKMRDSIVEVELDVTSGADVVTKEDLQAEALIAAHDSGVIEIEITDWDHNVIELNRTIQ